MSTVMVGPLEEIRRLEACEIRNEDFRHRDHVRMAWNYLHAFPLAAAIGRYSAALRNFATSNGHPERYHETLTWAYLLVVNERMVEHPRSSWDDFASANPDLFVWPDGVLSRYYRAETLASQRARVGFVMPDRLHP